MDTSHVYTESHLRHSHLLAVFTLEAKKHPFATDCACLRHPVLGGEPVGNRQKVIKGKGTRPTHSWEDASLPG